MNFGQLHSNLNSVIENINSTVLDLASENKPSLVELNTDQLWQGKGNDNQNLSPKYSQDPYFKSSESARKYADWKWRITPGKRDKDVPNLYINGAFYKSIYTTKTDEEIKFDTSTQLGKQVTSKFTKALGLNKESLIEVKNNVLPKLIKSVRNELTGS